MLTLFNGDFVARQSKYLADRVIREVGNDVESQIDYAWRLTLCRQPSDDERRRMIAFIHEESQTAPAEGDETKETARREALTQICRVLFNLNEFAYPN